MRAGPISPAGGSGVHSRATSAFGWTIAAVFAFPHYWAEWLNMNRGPACGQAPMLRSCSIVGYYLRYFIVDNEPVRLTDLCSALNELTGYRAEQNEATVVVHGLASHG